MFHAVKALESLYVSKLFGWYLFRIQIFHNLE